VSFPIKNGDFPKISLDIPSGKRLQKTMETSTRFSWQKFTISMVIFHSYVKLPEGICRGKKVAFT